MAPKWKEIAENNLEKGDKVERTYPARLEGRTGYMLLSGKKFQFVNEEGFLRKSYDLTLDLPYEQIDTVTLKEKYILEIMDKNGKKHDLQFSEIPATTPQQYLNDLMSGN
jgi:hypothetical protein